jgi:hypothetical protein
MTNIVEKISLTQDDLAMAAEFAGLPADEHYGQRRFPGPHQYERRVEDICSRYPSSKSVIYVLAQRDWHIRGQTGCMFARLAALQAANLRWVYLVSTGTDPRAAALIRDEVQETVKEPDSQVLSILMPKVRSAPDAIAAIRSLTSQSPFWMERDETVGDYHQQYVRCSINDNGQYLDAWVMAFGPFAFMPNTRRGPYFELAIRIKMKPTCLFHRLNQDRNIAHLADVPLEMSGNHWEHRWTSTLRRTRMILGGEPNEISAAKATFSVPTQTLSRSCG